MIFTLDGGGFSWLDLALTGFVLVGWWFGRGRDRSQYYGCWDPLTIFYLAVMAISGALSYTQSKKAQQEAKKARDAAGGVLINRQGTVEQIPVVYGTRRVGGVRVYATSKEGVGSLKNDTIYIALVLCEGPVESITDFYINGEPYIGSKYQTGGYCTFTTYLGTDAQTADPTLVALNDGWTSDHKLSGLAYIVFSAGMSSDIDENPWTGGMPEITALVKGKLVYDPRDASTAYSDNAALCIRDYLTNTRYGKGLTAADAIDDTLFSAAATALDATTTLVDAPTSQSLGAIVTVNHLVEPPYMTFSGDQTAKLTLGGTIQNAAVTITGSILGPPFYDAPTDTTFVYFFPTTGTFTVSTVVETAAVAVSGSPFGCHAVLDTDDTLFDNLNKLIMGCRGFIPYSNGKYGLILDGAGSSVMSFGLDTIVGGIELQGTEKKDKFNQMIVTFPNPELAYQPDQIIYPVPDSTEDSSLLAIDGERMSDTFEVETLASRAAAYNLAKILLIRSRYNNRITFNTTSEGFNVVVGDVIDITHSSFGWTGELFKVESVSLNYDGTCGIAARQYIADAYDLDSVPTSPFWGNPTFPNSTTAQPPTSLVLVETTTIANDGSVIPALSVAWTAALDSFVTRYEVQWKKSTDTEYDSVMVASVQTRLTGLETGVTYDVQVRSLNGFGSYSTWLTGSEVIDGDTVAPSAPTSLAATAGYGTVSLAWTNPTEDDFWQAKIWRNTTNDPGTATLIASIAGDRFVDVIGAALLRYYWVSAIDHTGNESAKTTVASATSLSAGGVNTYYQTSAPGGTLNTGDLWFDTDDGNAAYRWSGSTWVSVDNEIVADFNDQNNRNGSSITAPTITSDQTAVDAALTDSKLSADVSFEWSWGGDEADIDGFYVYLYDASSASTYTFGSNPDAEKKFLVPANVRSMILYSVDAERNYTFGVQAYRRVDPDVNAAGEIVSSLVKPSHTNENPFNPATDGTTGIVVVDTITQNPTKRSSSVAYGNGAIHTLDYMAADNKLTPQEKLQVLREWNSVTSMYNQVIITAAAAGVSYTALTTDYDALGTYLNAGVAWTPGGPTPSWLSTTLSLTTNITGSTFRTNWKNFYDEYEALLYLINAVNVNPGNPIDDGNVDAVVTNNAINIPEAEVATVVSGSGIGTWATLCDITLTRLNTAGPAFIHWSLAIDYTGADVNINFKVVKYRSNGTTVIRTLGTKSMTIQQQVISGTNIDNFDDFSVGSTYVYKLEWQAANTIDAASNLIGEVHRK